MRSPITLLPLLFILADGVACKEDEPATGAEFGEPCDVDEESDQSSPCGMGLYCFKGYCEETCEVNSDCQPVAGFRHECVAGLCHIYCDAVSLECPQSLEASPLMCSVMWCEVSS
ncbi:MAG: hypothetical protein JNL82_29560 [Myxococcales bacterium]|nr:hypothetical protein [Myxococcales bacterium]